MAAGVYLVEDEEWIRKGIKKMIRWDELDLVLLGEAEDGLTARDEILKLRPQIIISDIRIPRLDGLALVREVSSAYPAKTIFISGYREFEYARQAIELEAVSYILKPIDAGELNRILRQTVQTLTKEQKSVREADYGKAAFLLDVLDERVHDPSVYQSGGKNCKDSYCVLLIPGKEAEEELLQALPQKRREPGIRAELIRKGKDEWVIIFSGAGGDFCAGRDFAGRVRRLAQAFLTEAGSGETWALGGPVAGLDGIPVSYHQAWQAYMHRGILSEGGLILWSGDEEREPVLPSGLRIEAVVFALETADEEKLMNEQKQLFEEFYAAETMGMQEIRDCIFYICMELIRALQKNGVATGRYYEACRTFLSHSLLCRDMGEVASWLGELLTQMCRDVKKSRAKSIQIAVEKVRDYIDAHYTQSLSLTELADMVYVNPNYLSTSFKRLTGEGFVDYVMKKRMNKAAELLQKTGLSVAEIAALTGYENVRHFSRLFRKTWDMTPSEYRELCGKGERE